MQNIFKKLVHIIITGKTFLQFQITRYDFVWVCKSEIVVVG